MRAPHSSALARSQNLGATGQQYYSGSVSGGGSGAPGTAPPPVHQAEAFLAAGPHGDELIIHTFALAFLPLLLELESSSPLLPPGSRSRADGSLAPIAPPLSHSRRAAARGEEGAGVAGAPDGVRARVALRRPRGLLVLSLSLSLSLFLSLSLSLSLTHTHTATPVISPPYLFVISPPPPPSSLRQDPGQDGPARGVARQLRPLGPRRRRGPQPGRRRGRGPPLLLLRRALNRGPQSSPRRARCRRLISSWHARPRPG